MRAFPSIVRWLDLFISAKKHLFGAFVLICHFELLFRDILLCCRTAMADYITHCLHLEPHSQKGLFQRIYHPISSSVWVSPLVLDSHSLTLVRLQFYSSNGGSRPITTSALFSSAFNISRCLSIRGQIPHSDGRGRMLKPLKYTQTYGTLARNHPPHLQG